MMLTTERKAFIRQTLARDGRVVAKDLSRTLGLSEDTIRRDLRELARDGALQRVHGGALPASSAVLDYRLRREIATEAKVALANAAAGLVEDGQVIFLDGGTTNFQLARALPVGLRATVVTHSPSIAVELADHPTLEVHLIGGRLFKHSVVTVGAAMIEALNHVRPDVFFLGVTGLHADAGLTTGDAEEAAVKRAILDQSAETVVLATVEKIGAASPFTVAPISDASTIVVEARTSEAALGAIAKAGVTLMRAE